MRRVDERQHRPHPRHFGEHPVFDFPLAEVVDRRLERGLKPLLRLGGLLLLIELRIRDDAAAPYAVVEKEVATILRPVVERVGTIQPKDRVDALRRVSVEKPAEFAAAYYELAAKGHVPPAWEEAYLGYRIPKSRYDSAHMIARATNEPVDSEKYRVAYLAALKAEAEATRREPVDTTSTRLTAAMRAALARVATLEKDIAKAEEAAGDMMNRNRPTPTQIAAKRAELDKWKSTADGYRVQLADLGIGTAGDDTTPAPVTPSSTTPPVTPPPANPTKDAAVAEMRRLMGLNMTLDAAKAAMAAAGWR